MSLLNRIFLALKGVKVGEAGTDSGKIMATGLSYFSFTAETDSISRVK